MRTNNQNVEGRKGFVSVYLAFSSFLLIPVAGLAIDFSVLYSVKAKLQTACDAAAVGSGSTLNRSAVMDATAVREVALRFFNANYPTGYFGTTPVSYAATPVEGALGIRTITINATQLVPMLFLRVLGINQSMVGATAQVTVRFVNMILVVDRSGSVYRATAVVDGTLQNTRDVIANKLHEFVDPCDLSSTPSCASPYFSNGRDNIGLLSFGTSYRLDFPLSVNFQKDGPSRIGTAIDNIDLHTAAGSGVPGDTSNSTNTADGLFHAYRELEKLGQAGALNVIVLLTDGRPTAFSGIFPVKTTAPNPSTCTDITFKKGVLSTPTGWLPPTPTGQTTGVLQSTYSRPGHDADTIVPNNAGCFFKADANNAKLDIPDFGLSVEPPDDNLAHRTFLTTSATSLTRFLGQGTATTDPRALRYAAFNVADNVATRIRSDTAINPYIFVIGLNNNNGEEALDDLWLGRVANDRAYKDLSGTYAVCTGCNAGQTEGKYYNVTAGGIGQALRDIASQILRLTK